MDRWQQSSLQAALRHLHCLEDDLHNLDELLYLDTLLDHDGLHMCDG